jgi:hypothetical protein
MEADHVVAVIDGGDRAALLGRTLRAARGGVFGFGGPYLLSRPSRDREDRGPARPSGR